MKEKLIKALNNYLSNPQLKPLFLFSRTLEELSQGQRVELELFIAQEEWLVQLSKAQKDERVQSILDVFKHHGFKIPQDVASTQNLLPFYVHPKNRSHLKLKDFLAHPNTPTWDEVYSDHKPQVISCPTEKGNSLELVTYNVALTGPLMVNNIREPDHTVQSSLWKGVVESKYNLASFKDATEVQAKDAQKIMSEMYAEREQRLIKTLKAQALAGKPILLLQEASESFVNKLKQELGEDWRDKFSGDGKNIATLWNMSKVTLADEPVAENPRSKTSSINFIYQGEAITITNGHFPHETRALEGEPAITETLEKTKNHFLCGDFNRRLPPLDDGFHHNGTGNNNYNLREEYDCTDGGFTFKEGQIIRLESQVINEQTGRVANRGEVTVAEALRSDTYQECVFPQNYFLDGFHKKMSRLNIEMEFMSLEKNIYNVSRVTIKSKNNITKELAKEFPYVEATKNSKNEFQSVIYTSPYIMQAKLIAELNQNPDTSIDPLLKATHQILKSDSSASLKQQALNDLNAATTPLSKYNTGFKIASVFAAIATVVLTVLFVVFPPLGIAAAVTALIGAGLYLKGVSDENKVKQLIETITSGEQLINTQIEQEKAATQPKPLDTDSPTARREVEAQIKASKNERLLAATRVSQQAKMMQQLLASRPIFDAQDSHSEIATRWQALSGDQAENMSTLEKYLDGFDYKQAAAVLKTFPLDVRQNIGMYFKPGSETIKSLKNAMLDKTFREVRTGKEIEVAVAKQPQEPIAQDGSLNASKNP